MILGPPLLILQWFCPWLLPHHPRKFNWNHSRTFCISTPWKRKSPVTQRFWWNKVFTVSEVVRVDFPGIWTPKTHDHYHIYDHTYQYENKISMGNGVTVHNIPTPPKMRTSGSGTFSFLWLSGGRSGTRSDEITLIATKYASCDESIYFVFLTSDIMTAISCSGLYLLGNPCPLNI